MTIHFKKDVVNTFLLRVEELGLEKDATKIVYDTNFAIDYKPNSPTVCLYFGKGGLYTNIDILDKLISDAVFILPIVSDLNKFSSLIPTQLLPINGFKLNGIKDVEAVVARMLEGLSLSMATIY